MATPGGLGLTSTQGGGVPKGKVEGVRGCEEQLLADPAGEGAPACGRTHGHKLERSLGSWRRAGFETCN